MSGHLADNSSPDALASMLEVDCADGQTWREQELAAVLRHQMGAPLRVDLGTRDDETAATFHDLLHHPAPPIELLVLANDFAKACRTGPRSALPKEVAAVIYFAAIAVARHKCGTLITQLSPEELRAGVEWVLAQPWVDRATRALFEQGTGQVGGDGLVIA